MEQPRFERPEAPYDVIVMGAGYAGLMAALRLGAKKHDLRVALINPRDDFVERIRLQESIVAEVAPRIASMSKFLLGTNVEFMRAHVLSFDAAKKRMSILSDAGERDIFFSQAICTLGSRVDTSSTPGVADFAYWLDPGDGPRAVAALRARLNRTSQSALRIVAIGGGATAIEAAGEIKTAWPKLEVTLVSRTRAGDFKNEIVEKALREELTRLGIRLVDNEDVTSVTQTSVLTRSGRTIASDICVWAGGMLASSVAADAGLAVDAQGRIWVDGNLRSISHPHILAAGDAAHPVGSTGAPYRMAAYTAIASGAHTADVILKSRTARSGVRPFAFSTLAQAIAVGRLGVLFPLDGNDRQALFVLKGRLARQTRDFFIWLTLYFLRFERALPGLLDWPGRHRVSRDESERAGKVAITDPEVKAGAAWF